MLKCLKLREIDLLTIRDFSNLNYALPYSFELLPFKTSFQLQDYWGSWNDSVGQSGMNIEK